MAKPVAYIQQLHEYITGVMERAEHHADNVSEVALALAGAIVWRKDDEAIEVYERQGKTTNVLWVRIHGDRYVFSFNHEASTIEMRQSSTHGEVLHSFTNQTTNREIKEIFQTL